MIELRGLTLTFPDRGVRALDGVSLRVEAGEHVALVGPSGSGKTTLLRALLGAVTAQEGAVRVAGVDPASAAAGAVRDLRRAAGVVRQGNDLVLTLPAWTNAVMGTAPDWTPRDWVSVLRGRPPRRWAARLDDLAEAHGIHACLPARVSQLSGGQRQRVALCRALLPGPSLLLADEPTAQLDPAAAAGVLAALRAVDGVTLVVATHDLAVARAFPRTVALRDGRVVHDGAGLGPAEAEAVYGVEA